MDFGPHIRRLANLSGIEEDAVPAAGSVRITVEGVDFVLPLAGIVDFAKEKQRLEKETKKVEGDILSIGRRLADPAFLDKADPDVVDKNRARLEIAQGELQRLAAAIALI